MPESNQAQSSGSEAARARAESLIGRVVSDRYRIDELVAMGGMGAVYRGVHLHMRKELAIKILHPETENFPELVARFEREAVAGAQVRHPHVAAASDLGKFDGGSYFLVLEFISGRTLREVIDEGALPWRRALRITRQLAEALGAAHEHGIVHRDVKPRNVMLVAGAVDFVKLIDFGFARVPLHGLPAGSQNETSGATWLTEAGVVFGTAGYMAPETALGMRSVDARSDLYVAGVILYEMLTGKHPWDETAPAALFAKHRTEQPPPLRERNPDVEVPQAVEALVGKLLQKDPAARPADARAVVAAIDAILDAEAERDEAERTEAERVEGKAAATVPDDDLAAAGLAPRKGSGRKVAMVIVALAAAAGVAALVLTRGDGGAPNEPASPSASASAKVAAPAAAPTTRASAKAASVDELYARRARADLLHAAEHGGDDVASSLLALAEAEPAAFHDADVRRAAVRAAKRLGDDGSGDADRVYFALAYKLGPDGLDVLYDVFQSGEGKAARRAGAILELQGPSERASPGLHLAWEFRKATCDQKAYLFHRAGAEGDARTLALMEELHQPSCNSVAGQCCYRHNLNLERAIDQVRKRTDAR